MQYKFELWNYLLTPQCINYVADVVAFCCVVFRIRVCACVCMGVCGFSSHIQAYNSCLQRTQCTCSCFCCCCLILLLHAPKRTYVWPTWAGTGDWEEGGADGGADGCNCGWVMGMALGVCHTLHTLIRMPQVLLSFLWRCRSLGNNLH